MLIAEWLLVIGSVIVHTVVVGGCLWFGDRAITKE